LSPPDKTCLAGVFEDIPGAQDVGDVSQRVHQVLFARCHVGQLAKGDFDPELVSGADLLAQPLSYFERHKEPGVYRIPVEYPRVTLRDNCTASRLA
jgi:hypothetical protein